MGVREGSIMARNSAEAQKREEETQEKAKAEAFYYQVFLTDSYAPHKKDHEKTCMEIIFRGNRSMKKTASTFKFLLTLGLAVSLSGCAGSGTWNSNWNNSWNNITGGVRNYGQYPMPNAQTCFTNPTLVAAKQQGLDNLEFQKAAEGISKITLVRDELIPATNQLIVQGNAQPLNALYAQIQPQTLANFMIGCNEVMVQERQQLIQERQQLIQHINTKRNQIAQWQNYLNTTPAPQPTPCDKYNIGDNNGG